MPTLSPELPFPPTVLDLLLWVLTTGFLGERYEVPGEEADPPAESMGERGIMLWSSGLLKEFLSQVNHSRNWI